MSDGDGRVQRALDVLRSRGERVTAARRAVLEALVDQDHLDADAVADRVGRAHPGVHRATIYRSLRSLVDQGLVTHTHVPDGATIYHLREQRHAHLQCVRCEKFLDVPLGVLDPVVARVREETGFEVDAEHAALLGTCADCVRAPRG